MIPIHNLKNAAGHLWYELGWVAKGTVILNYHSVGYDGAFTTVTPENFRLQMELLRDDGWSVISCQTLVSLLKQHQPLPRRTVALTFDDAYTSLVDNALPVLRELNLPATIFVATDYVGKEMVNSEGISVPVMDWKQITEISQDPLFDFGSHTASHASLTDLKIEEIEHEYSKSREELSRNLGKEVPFLAYPKGRYSNEAMSLASKYHSAAFVAGEKKVSSEDSLFAIPRRGLYKGSSLGLFKLKLMC